MSRIGRVGIDDAMTNEPNETVPVGLAQGRTAYPPALGQRMIGYFIIGLGLFFLAGTFLWVPTTSLVEDTGGFVWIALGGLLFFAFILITALAILHTRLVVSPEGIEYRTMGMKARAAWREVVGITTVRQGYNEIESLVLAKPTVQLSSWLRALLALMPFLSFASIFSSNGYMGGTYNTDAYRRTIPLSTFFRDWQQSPLGNQLRLYAPKLFKHQKD